MSTVSEGKTTTGPRRGAFIVFEGLDRSGKTTQSLRLVETLKATGHKVQHMRFPDRTTAIGKMIDGYLRSAVETNDESIHLLFSANRWEKSGAIRAALEAGETVVVDRYSYSGVAYSAAKGLDFDWCWAPERGLPAPDAVFYLTLTTEEAAKRGDYGEERYEKKEFQQKVGQAYEKMRGADWQVINAAQSIEDLAKQLEALASNVITSAADKPVKVMV